MNNKTNYRFILIYFGVWYTIKKDKRETTGFKQWSRWSINKNC